MTFVVETVAPLADHLTSVGVDADLQTVSSGFSITSVRDRNGNTLTFARQPRGSVNGSRPRLRPPLDRRGLTVPALNATKESFIMTTISSDQDVITLINVFTVDPRHCDELVQLLIDATHETMRHMDGFISANIHRSDDGRRVVNYAQWTSVEAFDAMRAHPDAEPHMRRAAALAEDFSPIICTVIETAP